MIGQGSLSSPYSLSPKIHLFHPTHNFSLNFQLAHLFQPVCLPSADPFSFYGGRCSGIYWSWNEIYPTGNETIQFI